MPGMVLFLCSLLPAQAQQLPFSKGVNLTNWFQAGSATELVFGKYTQQDFQDIKNLGADVIRLPINLHAMSDGAPDYTLNPIFLTFLDQAVDWAEAVGIHLILDNHTFDPAVNTPANIDVPLLKVWKQMASHYAGRSDLIHYEVLNEPHGITNAIWSAIQQAVIDTIRTVDQTHSIVVGGVDWNSYHTLDDLPVYSDSNLIYTFHFYEPFIFTHQGASWAHPALVDLANVPFPYDATKMPAMPSSFPGQWVEGSYNNYSNQGNVAWVQSQIDIAAQFQQARNVPVFCGEFGVFIPNSQDPDRVFWYKEVREYMESKNLGWTIWDYEGGFGIYDESGNGQINHDLNVALVNALGLTAPPQTPFVPTPDSAGFIIYSDFIGQDIDPANGGGDINYYIDDFSAYGDFHVKWTGPQQYQHIGFDFKPNRDLTYLVANNYALDFFIRGTQPDTDLDVRFIDSFEPGGDLPWRIRVPLNANNVTWDGNWNHLHLPLSSFTEQGSWDGSTWHNPQGLFDWGAIDRLEFVSEYKNQPGYEIWFDHIQITNLDTASTTTAIAENFPAGSLEVFPNPFREQLSLNSSWGQPLTYEIRDAMGRLVREGRLETRTQVSTTQLPAGLYLLTIRDGRKYQNAWKLWKK